jgi:hypothetical protein
MQTVDRGRVHVTFLASIQSIPSYSPDREGMDKLLTGWYAKKIQSMYAKYMWEIAGDDICEALTYSGAN